MLSAHDCSFDQTGYHPSRHRDGAQRLFRAATTRAASGLGSHRDLVWIESMETTGLRYLAERTDLTSVQLIAGSAGPKRPRGRLRPLR